MEEKHFQEIMMLSDFLATTLLRYRKDQIFAKSINEAVDYALQFHGDYIGENVDDFVQSLWLSQSFHDLAKAYCEVWFRVDAEQ